MSPNRWHLVTDIFHAALARKADSRAAYLVEACMDDPTLRPDVDVLLAHQEAGSFGEVPVDGGAMPRLDRGTRLGRYRIDAWVGAGGMGEVYRATDTRLGRTVAIKVLPAQLRASPDLQARFDREAHIISQLTHPHVCTLYDVGHENEIDFLVMEYLAGETLAQRLRKGPLPFDQALTTATEISDALAAAHQQGIIHRDLKPGNVMLTKAGAKLLDFGLAKLKPAAAAFVSATTSVPPTQEPPTRAGTIVGTVPYMSPEQVEGKDADARSDIFSFGAVLYEMLTGKQAFEGTSDVSVMAAIIGRDPLLVSSLQSVTPPAIDRLVRKCLAKNPEARWQNAADLSDELRWLRETSGVAPPVAKGTGRRRFVIGSILIAASLVAGVGLAWRWQLSRPQAARVVDRFDIMPPAGSFLSLGIYPVVAISPDGRRIVFVATTNGIPRLYVRRRDDVEARPILGTEGASSPAFSPDGEWLAFGSGTELKKTTLEGPPVTLAKVVDHRGIAWLDNKSIVFTPFTEAGLFRVPAAGGQPVVLSTAGARTLDRTHRWPAALPNGTAILFTVGQFASPDVYENSPIDAIVTATGERHRVLDAATTVRYASDHLIFARGGLLYVVPFDLKSQRVTGSPTTIVRGVAGDRTTGAVHFAVANDGTLVYVPETGVGSPLRVLTWVDQSGKREPLALPPNEYSAVRISPDGGRVALLVGPNWNGDVWTYDLRSGISTRLTADANNASPIWSKNGEFVYFVTIDLARHTTIRKRRADGSREAEDVAFISTIAYLRDFVEDESGILVDDYATGDDFATKRADASLISLRPTITKTLIAATAADELHAAVSPNGRWIAYSSDETGRSEIYVRNLSGEHGRWRVSNAGGQEPRWSADSKTLFFHFENRLMAVDFDTSATFALSKPRTLFEGVDDLRQITNTTYDVEGSPERFLMITPASDADRSNGARLRVVINAFGR
jgi:eukaryotic-like serine/threonine-protein kinase